MLNLNFNHRFSVGMFFFFLLEVTLWAYCATPRPSDEGSLEFEQLEKDYLTSQNHNLKAIAFHEQATEQMKKLNDAQDSERMEMEDDAVLIEKNETMELLEMLWRNTPEVSVHPSQFGGRLVLSGASVLVLLTLFLVRSSPKGRKAVDLLRHPGELLLLLKYKLVYANKVKIPDGLPEDDVYCYRKLTQVSRSFSAVILELPEELRDVVCNFYLVLRALDTVEDDMAVSMQGKVEHLRAFHTRLREPGWNLHGYGEKKEEIDLLENFQCVSSVFSRFKPEYQEIIEDITKRMGNGMADFAEKKRVVTIEDYNLYCHYVAGLVGIGLSRMFACSQLESPEFAAMDELANSMGLFLQKTNITRDYLEDVTAVNSRIFYPKDIWGKYAKDIADLKEPKNATAAVQCLNEMVTNAMRHIPDVLDYMKMLRHPAVFKFCAIPQAMAIATLSLLYNNHAVFEKEVKIRKGEAVALIMGCSDYQKMCAIFKRFVADLQGRIDPKDPNAEELKSILATASQKLKEEVGTN